MNKEIKEVVMTGKSFLAAFIPLVKRKRIIAIALSSLCLLSNDPGMCLSHLAV